MEEKIKAELVDIQDPISKENKIYIKFVSKDYKDGERFILLTPDEFDALVKMFVDKIVATAKQKNAEKKSGDNSEGGKLADEIVGNPKDSD